MDEGTDKRPNRDKDEPVCVLLRAQPREEEVRHVATLSRIIRTCTFEYSAKDIARRKDVFSWLACTHSANLHYVESGVVVRVTAHPSNRQLLLFPIRTGTTALKRILIPIPIFIPNKTQRQSEDEYLLLYCNETATAAALVHFILHRV